MFVHQKYTFVVLFLIQFSIFILRFGTVYTFVNDIVVAFHHSTQFEIGNCNYF